MAFYLKYRPQKISELDLPEVREALTGLLKSKSIPHALLFTGIRGTGKTSSARIWAKAVNCEQKNKDLEPCNKCASCLSITKGNCVDVIEMDAASNRKIDDIRELREKVRLAPATLKYKVYIIDEVHMLTNEAFNALLKTLEEPPANVLFVLCTTETGKLPDTIVSRCVRVNFRMASIEEISISLARVAQGEKIKIDKEGLALLARLGEGSFRDATKLLEEIAWMEGEITRLRLEEYFHMSQGEMEALGKLLNEKDALGIMNFVEQKALMGGDMKLLAGRILDYLHSEWRLSLEKKCNLNYSSVEIANLINTLDEFWWRFNTSLKAQLPLELALINWLESFNSHSLQKGVELPVPRNVVKHEIAAKVQPPKVELVIEKEIKQISTVETNVEKILQIWEEILGTVKQRNISVEAFLRAAKPVRLMGDLLTLELAYSFHRDKLLEEANRRLVETVISDLLAFNLKIECVLNVAGKPQVVRNTTVSVSLPPKMPQAVERPAQTTANKNGSFRRRTLSSQSPVPTEEDEALVQFAEELFGE